MRGLLRWVFRWLFRLLILLILLAVAGLLLLDTIAREITIHRLEKRTGLEVKIGRMNVGLFQPRLTIENLVIYNRAEFGGSPLLDLPELHLECDRSPLFYTDFHFKLVRLNLARLNLVEDAKGRRNLGMLNQQLQKSGGTPGWEPGAGNSAATAKHFPRIDTLNLSLGRATYMNMKNPRRVSELVFDVHNQVYTAVTNNYQIQTLLLAILINRQNLLGPDGQFWLNALGLPKPAVKSSP
jgi:uncharacterized protein involved in outer membrane biogenesis